MSVEFDFGELKQKLNELETKVAGEITDNALKLASAPVLEEQKQLIPVDTGELKAAASVSGVRKIKGTKTVQIGFNKGAGRRNVEVGWLHNVGFKGKPGKFFMEESLENTREEALEIIARELKKALEG